MFELRENIITLNEHLYLDRDHYIISIIDNYDNIEKFLKFPKNIKRKIKEIVKCNILPKGSIIEFYINDTGFIDIKKVLKCQVN